MLITFISVVSFLLLIYALLWLPPVQQLIADFALKKVMEKTHSKISVGNIKLKPFSSIELLDIYAEDLKGDTLLYARKLTANFSLTELFSGKLHISKLSLDSFTVKLAADSIGADLNLQFFIDAFASETPDTTKSGKPFELAFDEVSLSNGSFSYHILSEPQTKDKFNSHHIDVRQLQLAATGLRFVSVDDFSANIQSLSFSEHSGFKLNTLSIDAFSKDKQWQVAKLLLQLPHSELQLKNASINYSASGLSGLITDAAYKLPLNLKLWPADIAMFYSPLKQQKDTLKLNLRAEGTLPALNVQTLLLDYGSTVQLDTKAALGSYLAWDEAPINLNIARLSVEPEQLNKLIQSLSPNDSNTNSDLPVNIDVLTIKAQANGALPAMQLQLHISSARGSLAVEGKAGYRHKTGEVHFDVQLASEGFNLSQLLNNTPQLGLVSMKVAAKGGISSKGDIRALVDATIGRFDYNGYSYKDILASASYAGDSLHLIADIKDSNAPLYLEAFGKRISQQDPYVKLQAKANHVKLATLNFTPTLPGADLYTTLNAEVSSFNIDRMKAQLSIDTLAFGTDKGLFTQGKLLLTMQNEPSGQKMIDVKSEILTASVKGHFSFNTLANSINNTLAKYLAALIPQKEQVDSLNELHADISIGNTEQLSSTLGLPIAILEPSTITTRYHSGTGDILLLANIPQLRLSDSTILSHTSADIQLDSLKRKLLISAATSLPDTLKDTLTLSLKSWAMNDSLGLIAEAKGRTNNRPITALLAANTRMQAAEGKAMPDIFASILPSFVRISNRTLNIKPATLAITDKRYLVNGLEISDTTGGYLRINGALSAQRQDSVTVSIGKLKLAAIMDALRSNVKLAGEANGDIIVSQALGNPIIFTNGFSIDSISLDKRLVGNLFLQSRWNNEQQSLSFDAKLLQSNQRTSQITGSIFPQKKLLSVTANLQDLELSWLQPMTSDFLYGLSGQLGLKLKAEGTFDNPTLSGALYTKNATVGVNMTNVLYSISDTIQIEPTRILMNSFRIRDNAGKQSVISGYINHKNFADLTLDLNLKMKDFLLLNNPTQVDSLVYGKLKMNADINISGTSKAIMVKGSIQNSDSSKVLINMPESVSRAQEYSSISYINRSLMDTLNVKKSKPTATEKSKNISLPIKIDMAVSLNPNLTVGAVINPATKDVASVSGTGDISFSYDLSKSIMSLFGEYTIDKGSCVLSIKNLIKEEFKIQKGGTVIFKGDPMATAFDVIAVYNLRADLATLDDSFSNDPYLVTSRVPVSCLIGVSGDAKKMDISYHIALPTVDASVQRKVDGIIYTDEIRIREIAYLLAMGSFYAPEGITASSEKGGTLWNSILSSTLTSQLNNLLSGVLKENWTIGTDIRSGRDNETEDNLEMDVNVSTNLLNNRLTVNSTLGYKKSATSDNNFSGDFNVEYKLTKNGEVVVKVYNVTNDQFYEQAPTTQGLGLGYKREAKRFRDLFKRINSKPKEK